MVSGYIPFPLTHKYRAQTQNTPTPTPTPKPLTSKDNIKTTTRIMLAISWYYYKRSFMGRLSIGFGLETRLLYILASFRVLLESESWSNYYLRPFSDFLSLLAAKKKKDSKLFLWILKVGLHPNAGWLSERQPIFVLFRDIFPFFINFFFFFNSCPRPQGGVNKSS